MSDAPATDGLSYGNEGNETWARRWSPVATHPHWLRFPDPSPHVHFLMGALLLAVGAAGLLGNALVLVVFTRFRRLRGPFSAFIVNLAVADLTTSLLHGMVAASCFQGHWIFGTYGCIMYAFGVGYFGLLSIVTLSAIAVERYLVITAKPLSASWKLSQFGARKVCVGAWLYCVCLCVPPLFGWSAYIPEGFLTSCSWDYLSRTPANRAFYIYLLTMGFLVPVVIIAYCYVFILAAVLAHSKEMRSVKHTGGSSLRSPGAAGAGAGAGAAPATTPRSMLRTAEIIIMLVALFLVSWTPYAVVTLIAQFGDLRLVTPWVATLPAFFAKASVVYNPIVYGLSHPHFRASLKQYLSSCQGARSSVSTMSLAAMVRDGASTPGTRRAALLALRPRRARRPARRLRALPAPPAQRRRGGRRGAPRLRLATPAPRQRSSRRRRRRPGAGRRRSGPRRLRGVGGIEREPRVLPGRAAFQLPHGRARLPADERARARRRRRRQRRAATVALGGGTRQGRRRRPRPQPLPRPRRAVGPAAYNAPPRARAPSRQRAVSKRRGEGAGCFKRTLIGEIGSRK